ncbi:hypothetical protein FB567DRAFT_415455, partial [Paraphoma chrysanthemicola]
MSTINLRPLGSFAFSRAHQRTNPLHAERKDTTASVIPVGDAPPPYSKERGTYSNICLRRDYSSVSGTPIRIFYVPHDSTLLEYYKETTLHEVQRRSPVAAQKPKGTIDRFRRYLIELIALTLGADFDVSNSALYNDDMLKGTDSILSAEERTQLLALSRLVEKVRGQVRRGQKVAVDSKDSECLRELVLDPFDILNKTFCMEPFNLDLLGWYSQPLAWPVCFDETIPGYWK